MTIGLCTNRKFLTLQVKKHEFTPVLPDFLIKCTKAHTRCRTIASCGKSKFQLSFPTRYNRAGAVGNAGEKPAECTSASQCQYVYYVYGVFS